MDSVEKLRKKVKENDEELVRLLGERMKLTDEIGRKKKALGEPVRNPKVEKGVIANAQKVGAGQGLSPQMVEAVMRTLMAESRLRQESARIPRTSGLPAGPDSANISGSWYLPPPLEFRTAVPRSEKAATTIETSRCGIRNILDGKDERAAIIMGPCSIHDPVQAEEYAGKMLKLKKKVDDRFLLVMRVYVEKSRSGSGWTGYLTEPYINGTGDVQEGITQTRKLLNRLAEMGIPSATEFINPLSAQYIGDLVSWAVIGARSSGSQTHRDMASSLGMPVGFKNGTDGGIEPALGAIEYASQGHDFIGIDDSGNIRTFRTRGNSHCHLILRGGEKPNYDAHNIAKAQKDLKTAGLPLRLVVDCSHGNSGKIARNQVNVFNDVIGQIDGGNRNIVGLMLESHLKAGKQKLPKDLTGFDPSTLRYGVSVTDDCLGWDDTKKTVLKAHESFI